MLFFCKGFARADRCVAHHTHLSFACVSPLNCVLMEAGSRRQEARAGGEMEERQQGNGGTFGNIWETPDLKSHNNDQAHAHAKGNIWEHFGTFGNI